MDTWTSISKIRTAKAEFCGSKMSSALKEPRNSALAVLILEIDIHVSTYLLLSGRTLIHFGAIKPTFTPPKIPIGYMNILHSYSIKFYGTIFIPFGWRVWPLKTYTLNFQQKSLHNTMGKSHKFQRLRMATYLIRRPRNSSQTEHEGTQSWLECVATGDLRIFYNIEKLFC